MFEQNISEQEKKRQLLTFLSEGVNLPEFLIEKEYTSENQIKTLQYLQLDNLYKRYLIPEEEITKMREDFHRKQEVIEEQNMMADLKEKEEANNKVIIEEIKNEVI